MKTPEEIRRAFDMRYPDNEDDQFSIESCGFVHEHPLTAIGVVLISSIVLGTTDVNCLAEFTRYEKRFLGAVSANMETAGFGKTASIIAPAGRVATVCLAMSRRITSSGTTFGSERAPAGLQMQTLSLARTPAAYFCM